MFWRHLENVLARPLADVLAKRLKDVLKVSSEDKGKGVFIKTSVCWVVSVKTGSILSSTVIPGPWMISGISFSTPSKSASLMACHSSSGNAIAQSNFFWYALLFFHGEKFFRGCLLYLLLFFEDLFNLQFGLWFCLDLILPKEGPQCVQTLPWVHPSGRIIVRNAPWNIRTDMFR